MLVSLISLSERRPSETEVVSAIADCPETPCCCRLLLVALINLCQL
jgi:hypothetical protein